MPNFVSPSLPFSLSLSLTLSLLFITSHSLSLFLSHTCHLLRPKSRILSGPKDPKKFPLSLVLSKSQKTPTVKICQRCVFSRAQLFFFWPFRPFRKINNFWGNCSIFCILCPGLTSYLALAVAIAQWLSNRDLEVVGSNQPREELFFFFVVFFSIISRVSQSGPSRRSISMYHCITWTHILSSRRRR